MNNRLSKKLTELRGRNQRALAFFYTAGYPLLDSTASIGCTLADGGADILELGMPFSDPLADGPVIQRSSEAALRNGMSLKRLLGQVRELRRDLETPIVLMGYMNPILRYGPQAFFADAAAAGVDGLILPELPLEEAERYSSGIREAGLSQILLATPTTPQGRLSEIDALASGFVYCVSMTGVTGGQVAGDPGVYLRRVKTAVTLNPVLVGFGISTPEQASAIAAAADGVIIGSALIRRLEAPEASSSLESWVRGFREALDRLAPGQPSQ
jgi:tryptophan synthase alpha chain